MKFFYIDLKNFIQDFSWDIPVGSNLKKYIKYIYTISFINTCSLNIFKDFNIIPSNKYYSPKI